MAKLGSFHKLPANYLDIDSLKLRTHRCRSKLYSLHDDELIKWLKKIWTIRTNVYCDRCCKEKTLTRDSKAPLRCCCTGTKANHRESAAK